MHPGTSWLRVFGVVVGLAIFVGFIAIQATFLVQPPCTSGCPTLTPDQAAYSATVHGLAWVGMAALDLSVALSVMVAFFLNAGDEFPESARRSAFYFAALYLAAFSVSMIFMTIYLSSFLRFI